MGNLRLAETKNTQLGINANTSQATQKSKRGYGMDRGNRINSKNGEQGGFWLENQDGFDLLSRKRGGKRVLGKGKFNCNGGNGKFLEA